MRRSLDRIRTLERAPLPRRALGQTCALLVSLFALATPAISADIPFRDRFAAALKLPPFQACEKIESLLVEDPAEDDRRACIVKLSELLPLAAQPLTPDEARIADDLRARSQPIADVLLGRYVVLLASKDMVANAKASRLATLIDLAYVVERDLFAIDPVAKVGHRYFFFPDKTKESGWSIQSPTLLVSVGKDAAKLGGWDEVIAHEISHGFGHYHPARHMFAGGFFEGWGDLSQAYVGERLAFLGAPFAGRFAWFVTAFAENGKNEYLNTRLPIEEIVAYGPSSSLLMRLALQAGDGKKVPDWKPFKRFFRETFESPPSWTPNHLWPSAMARDLLRIFGNDRTWDVLAEYRFPLDQWSHKELEQWLDRAHAAKPMSRAERWKADGEFVMREWRVLGPIPDAECRHLAFDPLDAENFVLKNEYTIGGQTYAWRTDVRVDEDGVVDLSSLPGSSGPCVIYLLGNWPQSEASPTTFSIASDDEVAVWLDGELIDWFRDDRGTWPEDPDRAYARMKKGGGRILAEVANHGGKTGFHLRASAKSPFDYAYKLELHSPDAKRRLAAVRFLGSRRSRMDSALAMDFLVPAIDDGDASVRAAAAWALAGKRNDPKALGALLKRFVSEKESSVRAALQAAIEELTFQRFESSDAAQKWMHKQEKDWKLSSFVECEDACSLRTISGGFFGNNAGSFGGQCVARCWGEQPTQSLSLVLDARESGPRTFVLRYACARGNGGVSLRVKRGEEVVLQRETLALPATKEWTAWSWLELPLGEIAAGRYHVELYGANGCTDLDVMGWKPTPKSAK
jgi:hypothetical protein